MPITTTTSDAAAASASARRGHVGFPPRADDDPLSCVVDLVADGVVDSVRQLGPALVKEGADELVGVARRSHASRSCGSVTVRASASRLARSALVA